LGEERGDEDVEATSDGPAVGKAGKGRDKPNPICPAHTQAEKGRKKGMYRQQIEEESLDIRTGGRTKGGEANLVSSKGD